MWRTWRLRSSRPWTSAPLSRSRWWTTARSTSHTWSIRRGTGSESGSPKGRAAFDQLVLPIGPGMTHQGSHADRFDGPARQLQTVPVIELRSDNAAGVAPEILAAIEAANTGSALAYGGGDPPPPPPGVGGGGFEHPTAPVFPGASGAAAEPPP